MPAGSTYSTIATTTLGSAQANITFSSLGSYTDIVLVYTHTTGIAGQIGLRFNGDTGSNYSATVIYGEGSAAGSARTTSTTYVRTGHNATTNNFNMIVNIQNYSNSTTNKSVVARNNAPTDGTYATVGMWRNTAAITSITVLCEDSPTNLPAGAVCTIYGIAAA
jgi:hypothetical protein